MLPYDGFLCTGGGVAIVGAKTASRGVLVQSVTVFDGTFLSWLQRCFLRSALGRHLPLPKQPAGAEMPVRILAGKTTCRSDWPDVGVAASRRRDQFP